MPYVYSTLATSMRYSVWSEPEHKHALPIRKRAILVKGGAGIATKQLITPRGVRTEVTDEELELLKKDKIFQMHMDNGFITIDSVSLAPEKMAKQMNEDDKSKPLTPEKCEKDNGAKIAMDIKSKK